MGQLTFLHSRLGQMVRERERERESIIIIIVIVIVLRVGSDPVSV
jgi:hypothetical protein